MLFFPLYVGFFLIFDYNIKYSASASLLNIKYIFFFSFLLDALIYDLLS